MIGTNVLEGTPMLQTAESERRSMFVQNKKILRPEKSSSGRPSQILLRPKPRYDSLVSL